MKRWQIIMFLLVSIVLFSGWGSCQSIPYTTKSNMEKAITTVKLDYNNKIKQKEVEITTAKDKIINSKDDQIQGGANSFYALNMLYKSIRSPLRTDILFNNYSIEGWTALGNRMPTYEKMMEINERLKTELDENKTSFADLQKTHNRVVADNQKLVDATKEWEIKLDEAKRNLERTKSERDTQLASMQIELNNVNNQIIAVEKKRADDSAALFALKTKISTVCGIIVLTCLAGAIWSPIGKEGIITFGVVVGLAGAGIWLIPGWVIITVIAVAVFGLGAYELRKHWLESNTAKNVYRALESVKTKSKETFNTVIKPELDEWQTKRARDGTIVPDKAAIQHVDNVLIASGDK